MTNFDYKNLQSVLQNTKKGLCFKAPDIQPKFNKELPLLKNYFVSSEINKTISKNLVWAKTGLGSPEFEKCYLLLPLSCNLKCDGCFTGRKSFKNGEKIFGEDTLDNLLQFLKKHNCKSIVYAGDGELFIWDKAIEYVDKILSYGFGLCIFTNGTLLTKKQIKYLSKKNVSLIISLRDTTEKDNNLKTGCNSFKKSLRAIDWAVEFGYNKQNRLAVQMPVIKDNEKRIIDIFIPVMRSFGILPFVEEFVLSSIPNKDLKKYHDFSDCRNFLNKVVAKDRALGYDSFFGYGQRMLGQPKCTRPTYSFCVKANGDVGSCPTSKEVFGNIYFKKIKNIIYSNKYKSFILNYLKKCCYCSVFYTANDNDIPDNLPGYLQRVVK